ncbi:signal recognition particle-docking protein FtsY [Pasteuria penetrans]|uniref:signal recognition particle-docking protein FtsY n=1 Tax=Pasteuria penetrans TaxID=86005 RepID=UPI0011EC26F2|nr:signal recognition particle-docking protein FtsY [Pasteuria penetrans]
MRFFQRLRQQVGQVRKTTDTFVRGLSRTRSRFTSALQEMVGRRGELDEGLYDQLEMMLLAADVGVSTTQKLLDQLQERVRKERISDAGLVPEILAQLVRDMLISSGDASPLRRADQGPTVYLFVGVNGVGKTTTIGKLAYRLRQGGDRVLLAAGDTFRAGAIEQLAIWGERTGVDVIRQMEGADPAAVIYDGIQAAKARGIDVLLCDTAGRLQNKRNLMQELAKVKRVITRAIPEAPHEVLLVLDATTGQNALHQAEQFCEVVDITGLVLTKLDGTAKGGIVLAIQDTMQIPIQWVGLGECPDDLMPFDADMFVHAMFADSSPVQGGES